MATFETSSFDTIFVTIRISRRTPFCLILTFFFYWKNRLFIILFKQSFPQINRCRCTPMNPLMRMVLPIVAQFPETLKTTTKTNVNRLIEICPAMTVLRIHGLFFGFKIGIFYGFRFNWFLNWFNWMAVLAFSYDNIRMNGKIYKWQKVPKYPYTL